MPDTNEAITFLFTITGILSIALLFLPGAIFYTVTSRIAFPSGRFNLNTYLKAISFPFLTLFLILTFSWFQNHSTAVKNLTPKLMNGFLHSKSENLKVDLPWPKIVEFIAKDIKTETILEQKVLLMISLCFISLFFALITSLLFKIVEFEYQNNFFKRNFFPLYVRIFKKWITKWNIRNKEYLKNNSYFKFAGSKLLLLVVDLVFTCFLLAFFLIYFALVLVEQIIYRVLIFINHPHYHKIHKAKLTRQLPIIDIKSDGLLYRGVLVAFEPKNYSEIESFTLSNVIQYGIDIDQRAPKLFNVEKIEVNIFKNNPHRLTINFNSLDNYNIWYLSPNTVKVFKSNISTEHQSKRYYWYLRLTLEHWKYDFDFKKIINPKIVTDERSFALLVYNVKNLIQTSYENSILKNDFYREWHSHLLFLINKHIKDKAIRSQCVAIVKDLSR